MATMTDFEKELLDIGQEVPDVRSLPEVPRRRFNSRFFFRVTDLDGEALRRKSLQAPKVEQQSSQEVFDRSNGYEKELAKSLAPKIDQVREFFLKEITPLRIAAATGKDQAKSVLEQASDSEVDDDLAIQWERMLARAVHLRLAKFIQGYLELDESDIKLLIDAAVPPTQQRPQVMVMPNPASVPKGNPLGDNLGKVPPQTKR